MNPATAAQTQTWDLFCRVVDNLGDAGVCWRLARQLQREFGRTVRLWIDRPEALQQLVPATTPAVEQIVEGIDVRRWESVFPDVAPADVVVEAFACELPESYVAAMARRPCVPVWVNLEYLSAEAWVDECHGLTSPHPRWPLKKTFFFPGFTSATGGLLRERELAAARAAFSRSEQAAFLHPWLARDFEATRISLFCYENPGLGELLETWSTGAAPLVVFVTPGPAARQCAAWCGVPTDAGTMWRRGALTAVWIPFLTPDQYDRLLWACDINFVRGEDSFVRAQWARKPFVWQIYPQADGAHWAKLDAFLGRYESEGAEVSAFWQAWNGRGAVGESWPRFFAKRQALETRANVWADHLDRMGNLADNLVRFVEQFGDMQNGKVQ